MLPLIILGFVMMTAGVALLFLGEVPFLLGKRIPAVRSRVIGGILVGFLPIAWAIRQLIALIFGVDAVDGPIVLFAVFGICLLAIGAILFRVMVPKQERPPRADSTPAKAKQKSAAQLPEDEESDVPRSVPEPEPEAAPEPKRKGKKPVEEANPFDFS
jgi:hypothetical protein